MNKDWRTTVINKFTTKMGLVYIAYDFDRILSDSLLLQKIKAKGFNVVLASSALQVRYEYEQLWNDYISGKEVAELLFVYQDENLFSLPPDIENNSIKVSITLEDVFTHLSPLILKSIGFDSYEKIYEAYCEEEVKERLNQNKTALFILRVVYAINYLEVKTDLDFFALLLRIHYSKTQVPETLATYFSDYVKSKHRLTHWNDVRSFLSDSKKFWAYLQKLWTYYLSGNLEGPLDGPVNINLCNPSISVFLDNIIEDGLIVVDVNKLPSECPNNIPQKVFARIKNSIPEDEAIKQRVLYLEEVLSSTIPTIDSTAQDWLNYQQSFSEWEKLSIQIEHVSSLGANVNKEFTRWIKSKYESLSFFPSKKPIVVNRIADYLKAQKTNGLKKIALIVMDGMSYAQWLVIKDSLKNINYIEFDESSCFACIPTLTSVSRQSIFSGKIPRYFADSIANTNKEEKQWSSFWGDISSEYIKKNGTSYNAKDIVYSISPSSSVVGIVVNIIDDLMHGAILGSNNLQKNIKDWMNKGFFKDLCLGLLNEGFTIWVTADHGNLEVEGIGRIKDGVLPNERGTRVCTYSSKELRNSSFDKTKNALCWESSTLPSDYYAIIADENYAFTQVGNKSISHGGISIQEVIVPFVKIGRKK